MFDQTVLGDEEHIVDLDFGFPVVAGQGVGGADEFRDLSDFNLHVQGLVLDRE